MHITDGGITLGFPTTFCPSLQLQGKQAQCAEWAEGLPLRRALPLRSETTGCTPYRREPRLSSVSFTQSSNDKFLLSMWGITPELAGSCLVNLLPTSLPDFTPSPPPPLAPHTEDCCCQAATVWHSLARESNHATITLRVEVLQGGESPIWVWRFLWLFKHCSHLAAWYFGEGTSTLEVFCKTIVFSTKTKLFCVQSSIATHWFSLASN